MPIKAIVILAEGFEEIEAVTCIDVLRRAGIEVVVAGLNDLKVKAARNTLVLADKKLDDAGADFDACILPGGMPGAGNLAGSRAVNTLIKDMAAKNKLIAAICAAPPVVLIPTGVLKNRSATCYPGMNGSFGKDTVYKPASVVIDNNIITASGPATAMVFALAIVEKLCGKSVVDKLKKALLVT